MVTFSSRVVDVKVVIAQLRKVNARVERILGLLPTSDDKILAELDYLLNQQRRLMNLNTTQEKGTIFLEQVSGQAESLRNRYQTLLHQGKLRKKR
jgi:hypothetical protein